MRVLTWNVQGATPPQGSPGRIRDQVEFLQDAADQPDLLLLNEVTTARRELWRDELRAVGYTEIADSLDWAAELGESDVPPHHDINHVNGNLTAVHEDFPGDALERHRPSIRTGAYDGADLKHWSTNFPEKILVTTVETADAALELWNVRAVPRNGWGEEKVKILETVYERIRKTARTPCLLAGDFNAPRAERADGTIVPWQPDDADADPERWAAAETNLLSGLESEGLVDVFREQHGYGDVDVVDTSHRSRRFDHLLASKELTPTACHYDADGHDCSDHAPLIATFDWPPTTR
jgi:exodeoxyribonuclease-3